MFGEKTKSKEIRERFESVLMKSFPRIEKAFGEIEDPVKQIELYLKLSEFVLSKPKGKQEQDSEWDI